MLSTATSIIRTAAIATFVSFAFAASSHPADATEQTAPAVEQSSGHGKATDDSSKAMALRVEDRIKTLHDKLGITSAQKEKWDNVVQTMRANEAAISQLIRKRQQNAPSMTAVDDLQSYEDITQAHLDGLKKLVPAFQALYADLSHDQKKKADKVFGSFEDQRDDTSAKKHM